jgi:hypothetical protein
MKRANIAGYRLAIKAFGLLSISSTANLSKIEEQLKTSASGR